MEGPQGRDVNLNVLGTARVLTLARRAHALGALRSVVHVSTCYARPSTVSHAVLGLIVGMGAALSTQTSRQALECGSSSALRGDGCSE
jgi:hypothetical protein